MTGSHRRPRGQRRQRLSAHRIRRLEGGTLLALALIVAGLLTLRPGGGDAVRFCLGCGPHAGADAALNIALFLPIGAALALLGVPLRRAIAIGFGITLFIEMLQFALPIGRVASLSDLIMNIAGAAICHALTTRRRAILYPRSRSALRFALAGGSVWLLGLAMTAIGMRQSLPDGVYFGQLSPEIGGFEDHRGQVVSANLAGTPLPDGPLPRTEAVRAALRTRMHLDAHAQFGAGHRGLAPVVRVVTEAEKEVALLAQRSRDLVFRARVLASDFRFFTPTVVMQDALTGMDIIQGQTILIDAERLDGALRLAAHGREAVLPLHSGAGWMFFVPTTAIPGAADVASALWIGLPLIAVGYWTGRRARRRARRAGDAFRLTGTAGQVLSAMPALLGLVAVGLAGISAALQLSIPGPVVWCGALAGLTFGIAAGISSALSHDDRAHGVSRTAGGGAAIPEPISASGS